MRYLTRPQLVSLISRAYISCDRHLCNNAEDAAERGAKRAMTDVGLDGESAAADIRELRGLLEAFNTAKHTAWQTLVRMVTTGFILALVAGALIKLKFFGGH